MPLAPYMIAAQTIPSLYQAGIGISQGIQAKKLLKKTERPKYVIPQAYKDYLNQAKFAAGVEGLPGEGQIKAQIGREAAGAIEGVQQSGQSAASQLQTIAAVNQNTNKSVENLAKAGAEFSASKVGDLYRAELAMGNQQEKQNEWDLYDPYKDAMAAASALLAGSRTNINTALTGLAGTAVSGMALKDQRPDLFKKTPDAESGGATETTTAPPANYTYPVGPGSYRGGYNGGYKGDLLPPDAFPDEVSDNLSQSYFGMSPETSAHYGTGTMFKKILASLFNNKAGVI